MESFGIFRFFMQQASAQGARSNGLSALLMSSGTLLSAFLIALFLKVSLWPLVFLAVLSGINFLTFLFSYLFLLFNDRDALRSERFTLSKMAIEKTLTGDSLAGFKMIQDSDQPEGNLASIPSSSDGGI